MEYFDLYFYFKKGFLLLPGSIVDQPLWYLRMMRYIDSQVNKQERDKMKDLREKAKQG
jgi:hypothetical protein